ncbi:MAG TPA: lytic transglycosylase domain-containing protein, partial [Kiloniellaceae bacterium]|nr:lytic transglycosylase domain-containing protein [Kiloniellaceae bacterium]
MAWFQAGSASPLSPKTSNGAASYAAALLRQGRKEDARAVVRDLWIDMDLDNGKAEDIFLQRFASFLTAEDQQARLERLLWQRKEAAAYRQAKRLGPDYYALARARMALAYGRGGVDNAIRAVPQSLQNESGLLYDRARWRLRRGFYDGVVELLDPPQPDLAYAERWWPIREWTARKALAADDTDLAYRIASNSGLRAGTGFAESEWLAGWIALKAQKRPAVAYDHFIRLHSGVTSPISLARGAYWAGVAAEALDRKDDARAWFERAAAHGTTFYGQRAAERLGIEASIPVKNELVPDAQRLAVFQQRELVAVVRLLNRVGADRLEASFLNQMLRQAADSLELRMIADLAADVGRRDIAVRTAKLARTRGIEMNDHLYPEVELPSDPGPERALVLALIRQESAFDSKAVSRAGARGLMQLMPATARLVAKKIKLPYRRADLIADPSYNMTLGRAYLGQ